MQRFRVLLLALLMLVAPACAGDADETEETTTTSALPTTSTGPDASAADALALAPNGVVFVNEEGEETTLLFGTDAAVAEQQLRATLGEPGTEAPVVDCSAGVEPQQVVWPGFVMLTLDGKFAGWAARDSTYAAVIDQGQRITTGTPLVLVEEYLGPLDLARSPRGFEFVLGEGNATSYAGAFPSQEDTAPLIAFSAGLTCFAR